jgi:hypothetical protein
MTVAMIAVVIGLIRLAWMLMTRDSRPNEENAPPLIPKRPDAVPPSRSFPASEPVRFEPDPIPAPRKPVPRFEYIYGFVGGNPQRNSGDLQGFAGLNQLLFSGNGGVTIGASLHPYQAIISLPTSRSDLELCDGHRSELGLG